MNEDLQKALAAIKAKDAEGAKLILARLLQDEPDNVAAWVLMSKMAETEMQKAAFLRKILSIEPDHAYARQALATLQERADEGEAVAAAESTAEAPAAEEVAQAPPEAEPAADALPEEDTAPEAELAAPGEEAEPVPEEQTIQEEQAKAETGAEEVVAEREAVDEAEAQTAPPETALPLSTDPLDYEAQAEGDTLPPWMADEEVILEAPEPAEPEAGEDEEAEEEIPEWLAEEPEGEWLEQGTAGGEMEPGARAGTEEGRLAAPEPAGEGAATGGSSGLVLGLTVATIIVFLLLIYAAITYLPGLF